MDLLELIKQIIAAGLLDRLATNPAAQFGTEAEQFLGATLLPEQGVEGNVVEDESIRYRSIIANDAARYSPVQLKEGAAMFGSMLAKLAESDVGKEFTAQQYDQLRKLLLRGGTMEAQARFLGWLDQEVNLALLRINEKHRWNAIENASVTRLGDNGYTETVSYPDPSGHRRQIAADWEAVTSGVSDNDPFDDLFGILEDARDENVVFIRTIMSSKVQFKLLRNTLVKDRSQYGSVGFIPPNDGILRGPMAVPALTSLFQSQGFPAPEVFDGVYHDFNETTGAPETHRYLGEEKIVFVGATGQGQEIVPEEGDPFFVGNTVGYTAIGTPAGQDAPGRVLSVEVIGNKKPPRIEVEGWQSSLPLITSGEKLFVLDTEAP